MGWQRYDQATAEQQADFRGLNADLGPDWNIYLIWVTRSGKTARRCGYYRWTKEHGQMMSRRLADEVAGRNIPPSRDEGGKFKTADFHLDRYPK